MKENFLKNNGKLLLNFLTILFFFLNYSYLRNEQNILELTFFKQKKEHSLQQQLDNIQLN